MRSPSLVTRYSNPCRSLKLGCYPAASCRHSCSWGSASYSGCSSFDRSNTGDVYPMLVRAGSSPTWETLKVPRPGGCPLIVKKTPVAPLTVCNIGLYLPNGLLRPRYEMAVAHSGHFIFRSISKRLGYDNMVGGRALEHSGQRSSKTGRPRLRDS